MKSRIIAIAVLMVFLSAGVFGVINRQTYTDMASENNYMDALSVAVLREKSVISCCNALAKELPKVPIILQVKCVDELEYVFDAGQQMVHVEEVFKGSELIGEEDIYVYSERWDMVLHSSPISAERGFVNVMESGEEYLIFLSGKKVNIPGKQAFGYEVFSDLTILPIFHYGEHEHAPVELAEGVSNTYVPYLEVKGNELFSDTVAGYEAWLDLKERLFAIYN